MTDGSAVEPAGVTPRAGIAVHIVVTWADLDPAGVVFYPVMFGWMDRAAHALFREMGITTADELPPSTVAFPVVEANGRFLAPARFEESIEIRVIPTHVGRSSFTLRYEVRDADDGSLVAQGRETRVRAERQEGGDFRAVALDAGHRMVLERHLESSTLRTDRVAASMTGD